MSDVGGVFGIWIGISALSLTEVIQLVIDIIVVLLTKDRIDTEQEQDHSSSFVQLDDVDDPGEESSVTCSIDPEPPDEQEDIVDLVQRHVFLPEVGDYFDIIRDNRNNEYAEKRRSLQQRIEERLSGPTGKEYLGRREILDREIQARLGKTDTNKSKKESTGRKISVRESKYKI